MNWDDDLLDEIEARVRDGETTAAIAESLDVTQRTVRNWFRAARRVTPTSSLRRRRQGQLEDPEWLRACYLDDAMTPSEIATASRSTRSQVVEALKRHRIERPGPDEAIVSAFRAGESIRAMSVRLGVSRNTVRQVLRSSGLHDGCVADRPQELDDPWVMREWYAKQSLSTSAIARRLGVNPNTVARALSRHGIATRTGRDSADPRLDDRDWLERRWLDDHHTQSEIAVELGVGPTTVWRAMQHHDIQKPRHRDLHDGVWLLDAHRRRDIPVERLARWFRIEPVGVVERLDACGIVVRKRPIDYSPSPDHLLDVDWLHERYLIDAADIGEIAKQLGTSVLDVREALRASGIGVCRTRK